MSCAVLAGGGRALDDVLVLGLLTTVAWLAALHCAFAALRLQRVAIGTGGTVAFGAVGGLVLLSALTVWLPAPALRELPLAVMTLGVFVSVTAWEAFFAAVLASPKRVLLVGAGAAGQELVSALWRAPDAGFRAIGAVDDDEAATSATGLPVRGHIADLPEIVRRESPDLIVLAVTRNRVKVFSRVLEAAEPGGFAIVGLPEFYEHVFGRVPVRSLTPAWFMSVFHLYQRPYPRLAKRAFDLVVASVGLVLTAPLFVVIALLVRLTPGPVIYRQIRLGEGGRLFTMYKFRTMGDHAEEPGQPVWAAEHDPRATTVGRVLRKARLDELPQLWNVLGGEMSIVGPRPERPEYLRVLEERVPFWSGRHLIKPGITGWAQISRGYTADCLSAEEKLSYDLWYLRHRSVTVDFFVCLNTFSKLVSGAGAR